jgi:hypothetical protein
VRRWRTSTTLDHRGGRANLVVLALLALLGLLAMHGTPMPAMPGASGMHAAHVGVADPVLDGPDLMSGAMAAESGSTDHLSSHLNAAATSSSAHGVEGSDDQHPTPAHVTAPCVSDSARSHALTLAPPAAPVSPAAMTTSPMRGAAVHGAQVDRSPPDLSELCISRT